MRPDDDEGEDKQDEEEGRDEGEAEEDEQEEDMGEHNEDEKKQTKEEDDILVVSARSSEDWSGLPEKRCSETNVGRQCRLRMGLYKRFQPKPQLARVLGHRHPAHTLQQGAVVWNTLNFGERRRTTHDLHVLSLHARSMSLSAGWRRSGARRHHATPKSRCPRMESKALSAGDVGHTLVPYQAMAHVFVAQELLGACNETHVLLPDAALVA